LDPMAYKESKEPRVNRDSLVNKEKMENMDRPAHSDQKAKKVNLVYKVLQE